MKKLTFGTPEDLVPSKFCKNFSYQETDIKYNTDAIQFYNTARGCCLRLPLNSDEQIYGLGLQLKAFNLRGKKFTLRPNADPVASNGDSHAPVPFFVSTAGYGIYIDTARYAEFHFGAVPLSESKSSDFNTTIGTNTEQLYSAKNFNVATISIQIPVAKGVDIYIFEGKTITDIVAQYNLMSGGGCDVPSWALECLYRCYTRYSQDEVLAVADYFRNNNFKIGTIGLEPGWQTKTYSCSYVWSDERFEKPQVMINKLKEQNFHINLWEHAFVHPSSPIYNDIKDYSGDYLVWDGCVPDFATSNARKIFADHQKKLVNIGVDGFKLDECDGSDLTGGWSFPNMSQFPSGLDGEQYHSLFGTLYMQTILEALDGKPTLSEVRNAGALAASYPFVLYSDLYDHADFVRGCCTAGFGGLLWTPEVRDAKSAEEFIRRLQTTVFSPQCLINAWYCPDIPWKDFDCSIQVKQLLEIRNQLIPQLMLAFKKYKSCGIPPMRAVVSDYSFDPETYNIDNEYLLCENLLVAPILVGQNEREVYLPAGNWRDYFTKEPVASGRFKVSTNSIPVYEKH